MDTKSFRTEFERLQFERPNIERITAYLNREIQVHEIGCDAIRNTADAYQAIMEWNERIAKLEKDYNQLISTGYVPSFLHYQVLVSN